MPNSARIPSSFQTSCSHGRRLGVVAVPASSTRRCSFCSAPAAASSPEPCSASTEEWRSPERRPSSLDNMQRGEKPMPTLPFHPEADLYYDDGYCRGGETENECAFDASTDRDRSAHEIDDSSSW